MMIRTWLIGFILLALSAGCAPAITSPTAELPPPTLRTTEATPIPPSAQAPPKQVRADLPDLGAAPELTNDVWINTDAPLRLAELRGKVVLLDMWTFG